jgi:hypothetical protein
MAVVLVLGDRKAADEKQETDEANSTSTKARIPIRVIELIVYAVCSSLEDAVLLVMVNSIESRREEKKERAILWKAGETFGDKSESCLFRHTPQRSPKSALHHDDDEALQSNVSGDTST